MGPPPTQDESRTSFSSFTCHGFSRVLRASEGVKNLQKQLELRCIGNLAETNVTDLDLSGNEDVGFYKFEPGTSKYVCYGRSDYVKRDDSTYIRCFGLVLRYHEQQIGGAPGEEESPPPKRDVWKEHKERLRQKKAVEGNRDA